MEQPLFLYSWYFGQSNKYATEPVIKVVSASLKKARKYLHKKKIIKDPYDEDFDLTATAYIETSAYKYDENKEIWFFRDEESSDNKWKKLDESHLSNFDKELLLVFTDDHIYDPLARSYLDFIDVIDPDVWKLTNGASLVQYN